MPSNAITLLPDHVANQIAAGEVVQRPASVVKELIENAIDAGATQIQLNIRDAGKTLIQVIDNGGGMGPFDARMCFERHATSKIASADDLFRLSTKGFRGEALASIAAVAQVELRTRQEEDTVGTRILIDGGRFAAQEECQAPVGANFSVKNLFFNIPARRNFLKSDQIEQRHIVEEVERTAIPHTGVHFIVRSNGNEILNLPAGGLMQRIKALLGSYIQKELVLVSEDTSYVRISGYVSLPSAAVRQKKEQYLFVNNRFVRNAYLNHAVYDAYKDLIGFQSHPRYFLFLELDPASIDINIHPTKTEVKFSDDKTVYMLVHSAVKRALGKANVAPSLDFDAEMSIEVAPASASRVYNQPPVSYNPGFNPFESGSRPVPAANRREWEKLFEGFSETPEKEVPAQTEAGQIRAETLDPEVFQLNGKYIVTSYNGHITVIDQHRAHERVVYEHYMNVSADHAVSSQQLLFPEQVELSAGDFGLVKDLLPDLKQLGFEIAVFGKNSIVVNGVPGDLVDFNAVQALEGILESFKLNTIDARVEKKDNLCRAIARHIAVRHGKPMESAEMKLLVRSLLQCENPLYTAGGKVVMMEIGYNDIERHFRK